MEMSAVGGVRDDPDAFARQAARFKGKRSRGRFILGASGPQGVVGFGGLEIAGIETAASWLA